MVSTPPSIPPRRARLLAGAAALLLLAAGLGAAPAQASAAAHHGSARAATKLTVTSVKASSTPIASGTRVTTTVVVRNPTGGRKPTNDAVASLVGEGRTIELTHVKVPATAPGKQVTVTTTAAASLAAPAGTYAVQVCLAPRNQGACKTSTRSVVVKPAQLVATPGSLAFGDVAQGTTASKAVTITNQGHARSGVLNLDTTGAASFAVDKTTCGPTLAPGRSCRADVVFSPGAVGDVTGALKVVTSTGASRSVPLSGTGTGTGPAAASLSVSPATHDFGFALVGTTKSPTTFTVTNDGGVASGVPTVELAGADGDQFTILTNGCTAAVPAGGSCTVELAFAPTAAGPAAGRLAISAAPGGGDVADLSGTGLTAAALSISESTYDFGYSGSPAEHTFTITNNGTAGSGEPSVAATGDAAFAVTTNTCAASIPGGGSCTVGVTYTGSGQQEQTAQLSVSASPGGTVVADLAGSPQALTINPVAHDYGEVVVGGSSATASYTLTNHRLIPVQVDAEGITGPFFLDTGCFQTTIPAQGSCTFTGHFTPNVPGAVTGAFDYHAGGDQAHVDLSGVGLTPATLTVDRTDVQFGAYAPTTTGTQIITVTNTGDQATAAAPTVSITGPDAAEFNVADSTCTGPVGGGDSCTFTLAFAPVTLADEKSATATINGTPDTTTPTVALAGISAPSGVSFVPATYDYGAQPVGSSTTKTFRLVNTTDSGSEVFSGSDQTPFKFDFGTDFTCVLEISVIGPHSWCTASFAFRPQSPGAATGTISLGGDFGTAYALVSGTGAPARPSTGTARHGRPDGATTTRTPQSVVLRHGRPVLRY